MANIKPAEVSKILKQQLEGIQTGVELEEVGTVLQVGDGIARIYGLSNAQSNELIEFENGSKINYLSTSNNNQRGKRSELVGFYCFECKDMHEDYPIKNIQWIDENIMICKEAFENIFKPFKKEVD